MNTQPSRFSIVIPVFNRADCIVRCLRSVVDQDDPDIEIIVVDDASTDNTRTVVSQFTPGTAIRLVPLASNRGPNAARNAGVRVARGEWLLLLDSDDTLAPGALAAIRRTAANHPSCVQYLFTPSDLVTRHTAHPLLGQGGCELRYEDWITGRVGGDFVHVFRTQFLADHLFDEQYRMHEALAFWRLFRLSGTQWFEPVMAVNRERNRTDAISKEYSLSHPGALDAAFRYRAQQVSEFGNDLLRLNPRKYKRQLHDACLMGIALGKHADVRGLLAAAPTGVADRRGLEVLNRPCFRGPVRLLLVGNDWIKTSTGRLRGFLRELRSGQKSGGSRPS